MPTYRFKVIIVGDGNVGKTTLILKYTEKRFRESYIPTIGVQWTIKEMKYEGSIINLTLWDIAGQENFKALRQSFYEGSDAAIIVFDVTNLISFDHVENWYHEIQSCGNIPIILLGNKIDLVEKRKVPPEMIKSFNDKFNLPYFETSAKTGENVLDMFSAVIDKIHQFEPIKMDTSIKPPEPANEFNTNLIEEMGILEELIKNDKPLQSINKEFKRITNILFKLNPYHDKLEEMTQWRLEKLNYYEENAKLSSSDKTDFLNKIQNWKKNLN